MRSMPRFNDAPELGFSGLQTLDDERPGHGEDIGNIGTQDLLWLEPEDSRRLLVQKRRRPAVSVAITPLLIESTIRGRGSYLLMVARVKSSGPMGRKGQFMQLCRADCPVSTRTSVRHADQEVVRQRPEAVEPPLRLPIAFGGAAPELAEDAIKDLVADILRLPEVHVKGETANQGGEGLKALECPEPGRVGAKSMGHDLESLPEGVGEHPLVKGHVLESRLPEQLLDATQVKLLVLQHPVEAGVEDELGGR